MKCIFCKRLQFSKLEMTEKNSIVNRERDFDLGCKNYLSSYNMNAAG